MTADDLVDAALAGLDQGERVTIPTLHDGDQWSNPRALTPRFTNAKAAPRYVSNVEAAE